MIGIELGLSSVCSLVHWFGGLGIIANLSDPDRYQYKPSIRLATNYTDKHQINPPASVPIGEICGQKISSPLVAATPR